MNEREHNRLMSMPRGQFIHYAKDVILIALQRGTDEYEVITSLVVEDADHGHRISFLNQTETMYRTWGKGYYGKNKDHGWWAEPEGNPHE